MPSCGVYGIGDLVSAKPSHKGAPVAESAKADNSGKIGCGIVIALSLVVGIIAGVSSCIGGDDTDIVEDPGANTGTRTRGWQGQQDYIERCTDDMVRVGEITPERGLDWKIKTRQIEDDEGPVKLELMSACYNAGVR